MALNPVDAPRFQDGQHLRARDLEDGRTHQERILGQHLRAVHASGVVSGFELRWDEEGESFVVCPGLAVAGGRMIELASPMAFSPAVLDERDSERLRVYIIDSGEVVVEDTVDGPKFPCDSEEARPSRERRDLRVLYWAAGDPVPDPDSSVLLGSIQRADRTTSNAPPFEVDLVGRDEAGVMAGVVTSPMGYVRLRIGDDQQIPTLLAIDQREDRANDVWKSVLRIEKASETRLVLPEGGAQVNGEVSVRGGGVTFADPRLAAKPSVVDQGDAPAEQPWSIRTALTKEVQSLPKETHSLRVEVPAGASAFQVGYFDSDKTAFMPVLSVERDRVVVHGDLVVEGGIIDPTPPDPGTAPDVNKLAYSGVLSVMGRTADLVSAFNQSIFTDPLAILQNVLPTAIGAHAVLQRLPPDANGKPDLVSLMGFLSNLLDDPLCNTVLTGKAGPPLAGKLIAPIDGGALDEQTVLGLLGLVESAPQTANTRAKLATLVVKSNAAADAALGALAGYSGLSAVLGANNLLRVALSIALWGSGDLQRLLAAGGTLDETDLNANAATEFVQRTLKSGGDLETAVIERMPHVYNSAAKAKALGQAITAESAGFAADLKTGLPP